MPRRAGACDSGRDGRKDTRAADARVEQVTGLPTLSVIPNRTALGRYGSNVAELQDWVLVRTVL